MISHSLTTSNSCKSQTLFANGRAVTFNGKLSVTAEHNHLGESARVELKRLQGVVQRKAVLSKEAPRSIVADCIAGVSEEAKPLVRRSLLARNIRSIRNEENLEPANPKNLHELLSKILRDKKGQQSLEDREFEGFQDLGVSIAIKWKS
uniref:Uncharacterized protein n=1 Tax=Ditylenchus dipsaci TaxID=166011 RepID=A0A915E790_9BILA